MAVRALLLTVALAGCGVPAGTDPRPHAEVTSGSSDVRLVEEGRADLLLHVSNQSFDDSAVRLTVTVDGVTVVEGDFHVEDQHSWTTFPLALAPGEHVITAESDSQASLRRSFATPVRGARYAVVNYWGDDDRPHLEWLFRRRPVHFG